MACAAPNETDDRTSDDGVVRATARDQIVEIVIDTTASRVETANAAGRLFLGLSPSAALPIALDSSMPALQRLRQIAAGQTPRQSETLAFWCNGRLAMLTCSIRPRNANGSKHLIGLTERGSTEQTSAQSTIPQVASRGEDLAPAEEALPPIVARDDAETLREIARRIREGQRANQNISAHKSVPPGKDPEVTQPKAATAHVATTPTGPRMQADPPEPTAIAQLAHELKTPLSAIIAASEIMRDQRLGPMGNDLYLGYASDIHESAHHALAVITEMLEAAANASIRKTENFDLNELTAATISAMQPLAQARGLTLAHETGEGRLEINANPTAIRQILLNLLTNATKFTSSGGEVHTGTGYLPDGSIYLVVRDTGEGMDEERLARAFYEDAGEMSRRPGGGYGLGLPMVRRLAEANHGTIEIDSAPGKGTVVLIAFSTRR